MMKTNLNDAEINEQVYKYILAKKKEKEAKEEQDKIKQHLFVYLDYHGIEDKRNRFINTNMHKIKKEARVTFEVNNDYAVKFFEDNNWGEDIDVFSTIDVRKEVDPKDIPSELLKKINEFFEIKVNKTVSKEAILGKFYDKKIDESIKNELMNEKINYVLKVLDQ